MKRKRYLIIFLVIVLAGFTSAAFDEGELNEEIKSYLKEKDYSLKDSPPLDSEEDGIFVRMYQIQRNDEFSLFGSNLTKENVKTSAIVVIRGGIEEKYFIVELEQNESGSRILTLMNNDGEIKIDIENEIIIGSQDYYVSDIRNVNSDGGGCTWLGCMGHYIVAQLKDPTIASCAYSCVTDPTGFSCLFCLITRGAKGILGCSSNSCRWYPCQQNCDDNDYYGGSSPFCSEDDLYSRNYFYNYMCPSDVDEGEYSECILSNRGSGYVDKLQEECSDFCTENSCVGVTYPDYRLYHGEWFLEPSLAGGWRWNDLPKNFSNRPVLLVHGWSNDESERHSFEDEWGYPPFSLGGLQEGFEKELRRRGFEVWRLKYWPANLSIKKSAGIIGDAIKEILDMGYRNYNEGKVDVISHSMGGLAVMGYIEGMGMRENGSSRHYEDNIRKHVAIAAPLSGSYFANIVNNNTDIDILFEHPKCSDLVKSQKLSGSSEAVQDMEIGSDFTWELNNGNFRENVKYLTISGNKILPGDLPFTDAEYCLRNNRQINDGLVSVVDSTLNGNKQPLIVLDRFHITLFSPFNSLIGLNEAAETVKFINLFLRDKLNLSTVTPLLSDTEIYFNSGEFGGRLYPELAENGSLILELLSSENLIKQNSIVLKKDAVTYPLTLNKRTNRAYYLNLISDPINSRLDFTTMLPVGVYDIIVNGFNSNKKVLIQFGRVNFVKNHLDEDGDGYDMNRVGGSDCDDGDPNEFPNQTWYLDIDNDGYAGNITKQCERPIGYKLLNELADQIPDCNDNNSLVNSGAEEMCNFVDDNCNNELDEEIICKEFFHHMNLGDELTINFEEGVYNLRFGGLNDISNVCRLRVINSAGSVEILELKTGIETISSNTNLIFNTTLCDTENRILEFFVSFSPKPTIRILFPLNNSIINTSDVLVRFNVSNWEVGGKGQKHVHFHLQELEEEGLRFSDHLMFYNGNDRIIELNLGNGGTGFATWINENTVRLNNLPNGRYRLRAHLANEDHSVVGNTEADTNIMFDVNVSSMGIVKSLEITINSPYEGQIFILNSNSPGLYIDINVSTDEEAKCKVYPGMCSSPNEGIGFCLYPNPIDLSVLPSKNHFRQVFFVNNQNYMLHVADVECTDNSNQIFSSRRFFSFKYETCSPNFINSTWSDWTNISCLSMGVMNQSRSLVQYDSNNCGSILNKTIYEYRAILPCGTPNPPTYFLSLNGPNPGIYNVRRLNLDLNSNTVFRKIDFIDYLDTRPRWTNLCRNCNGYNKLRSFSDGGHNMTFRGTLLDGRSVTNSTNFFIDTIEPRIRGIGPRRGDFTNGSNFVVEYDEDNVKYVRLFWNPNITREDCPSGRNQACRFNVNLSRFNGQEIEYWFEIEDIADNRESSRKTKVKVDTISPIINSFDYVVRGRNVNFRIEINEQNFDSVEYIDYNERRPRWGALCARLRDGVCSARRSFRSGEHNLKIKVLDRAGNNAEKEIGFEINA